MPKKKEPNSNYWKHLTTRRMEDTEQSIAIGVGTLFKATMVARPTIRNNFPADISPDLSPSNFDLLDTDGLVRNSHQDKRVSLVTRLFKKG